MTLLSIFDVPKPYPVYTANAIKAWEGRWFDKGNSSFGLMEQASLQMANYIEQLIITSSVYDENSRILVCCGVGNNGGDGYLVAKFLADKQYEVAIFAPFEPVSVDCQKAKACADEFDIPYVAELDDLYDIYVDAFFGIGLNEALPSGYFGHMWQLNDCHGLKIALDIPSGLHPDTGNASNAFCADYTLCVMGLKMGLLTAKGRHHAGKIILIPLIAEDEELTPIAHTNTFKPQQYQRVAYAHKGDFGHVLIIGGHENMGGAVIMAGESAMACGAGKVTIMCHKSHHQAILSRSPDIMVKDIDEMFDDDFSGYLKQISSVAFGMGLGRDTWSEQIYLAFMKLLPKKDPLFTLVLDADALYFLAKFPQNLDDVAIKAIGTPHSAEAGRLLGMSANEVQEDRVKAIYQLQETYGANWVLKGSGSLTLEQHYIEGGYQLSVCPFGNAGMATAGMGDVLSGMMASMLSEYLADKVAVCVTVHALAGDELAKAGECGVSASDMPRAIKQVFSKPKRR